MGFIIFRGDAFYLTDCHVIATNKKTHTEYEIKLGYYGRNINMPNGDYVNNLAENEVYELYNISLTDNEYVDRNDVLFFESENY